MHGIDFCRLEAGVLEQSFAKICVSGAETQICENLKLDSVKNAFIKEMGSGAGKGL